MVKLAALPDREIIDKYKGIVDFYLWNGIAVARAWPKMRPRSPYPAEKANQDLLGHIMRLSPTLPANIKQPYVDFPTSKYLRWQDWLVRAYIKGIPYIGRKLGFIPPQRYHNHFTITSLRVANFGAWRILDFTTDIPCRAGGWIDWKPPRFTRITKWRRGAYWYYDYAVRFDAMAWLDVQPNPIATSHTAYMPPLAHDVPFWLVFFAYWPNVPQWDMSFSNTVVYRIDLPAA